MSSVFSAGPSALGYIYQILSYPLYLALQSPDNKDRGLFIERFDDIELSSEGNGTNSLQIKNVSTSLTNRSSDLWKTLRVWSENYRANRIQLPGSVLTLVTTAKAPDNSIAALLRTEGRDSTCACELLCKELLRDTPSLQKSFEAFRQLTSEEQSRLVDAIFILDQVPSIEELPNRIKDHCVGVQIENLDELYNRLQAWWLNQVIAHLRDGSRTPIQVSSIRSQIADINDTLKKRQLPDPFFDYPVPESYDWDRRTFVRQLRLVEWPPNLMQSAIRDFYRADALRTWLIDEVHLTELTSYDERLRQEWELRYHSTVAEKCSVIESEEKLQQIGREICIAVLKEVNIPIHQRVPNSQYITRGSYHKLADDIINLPVGWHPHYKDLLHEEGGN